MPDPLTDHDRIPALLAQMVEAVNRYFTGLDELPARSPQSESATGRFTGGLPEEGEGSAAALTQLLTEGVEAATRSAGPRFFHFVTGGRRRRHWQRTGLPQRWTTMPDCG